MGITRRTGAKNGRPLIAGTKIGVYQIYSLVEREGVSVDELVNAYRELSRDDVDEALSYAADHPDEMEEIERQEEQAFREGLDHGTTVLADGSAEKKE